MIILLFKIFEGDHYSKNNALTHIHWILPAQDQEL